MKVAIVTLESLSPYSQSKPIVSVREDKEGHDEFEQRTWRERIHADEDGNAFIPPMAFKWALEKAASMLRLKIPGKGQSEYGKHFRAGVLVPNGLDLPLHRDEIEGEKLFLNADGKRGSGKRVWRTMPRISRWRGTVTYYILDDTITKEVFEKILKESGNFVGIGRFRPENGGYYGRYQVESIEWTTENA